MKTSFCALLHSKDIRRVDMFISTLFHDKTRSYMQKLIEKGCVKINGKMAVKGERIRARDMIEIEFETEKHELEAENIPLDIVYENNDFAIINKDPYQNVHEVPGVNGKTGTLVNALLYHMKGLSVIGGIERPGIVHRLDKDTSGLIIIAKSDRAMYELQVSMNKRQIKKTYLALVVGIIKEREGYIESYIGRDPNDRKIITVVNPVNPKIAKTKFKVIGYLEDKYSLVEVDLLTGRTHQIRVHFMSIGHPLVGDVTYGNEKINKEFKDRFGLDRQFLHAWKLSFELFTMKYDFVGSLKSDHKKIYDHIKMI